MTKLCVCNKRFLTQKNKSLKGKEFKVLVDRVLPNPNGYTHMGRTEGQAIDIDGNTYLSGKNIPVGDFVRAKIKKVDQYDLFAEVV